MGRSGVGSSRPAIIGRWEAETLASSPSAGRGGPSFAAEPEAAAAGHGGDGPARGDLSDASVTPVGHIQIAGTVHRCVTGEHKRGRGRQTTITRGRRHLRTGTGIRRDDPGGDGDSAYAPIRLVPQKQIARGIQLNREVIHTREYQDRLDTLGRVRNAGLKVCCGGIVGMGETREQRAGLIAQLANLNPYPESVPVNHLVQVEGTPLHGLDPLP